MWHPFDILPGELALKGAWGGKPGAAPRMDPDGR